MGGITVQIEYTYIDENGIKITRLKPQKTVEQYRAHSGGLWGNDAITEITETTGELDNEKINTFCGSNIPKSKVCTTQSGGR